MTQESGPETNFLKLRSLRLQFKLSAFELGPLIFNMASHSPATPAALYKMISIPEAQSIVLMETQPLETRSTALQNAIGKILAADVHARDNLPPFPASIKVPGSVNRVIYARAAGL